MMMTNFLIATTLAVCASAFAATETPASNNSGVNERDRSATELTAEDQGNSERDIDLTRKIRQEVVKSDTLSTDAQNIKIITVNGRVTLKGPVKSQAERDQLLRISRKIAGNAKINNEIEVAK